MAEVTVTKVDMEVELLLSGEEAYAIKNLIGGMTNPYIDKIIGVDEGILIDGIWRKLTSTLQKTDIL